MSEQEDKNGISDGNQSGVRTENIQQNQSTPDQTERTSDTTENARSDSEQVFNAKGAAAYLNKDEKTIRNRIRDGRIKADKIGGTWKITKAALDEAFVNEHRGRERKTEQENIDARSTESPEKKVQIQDPERETEREITSPSDYRSDARLEALELQNRELERVIVEKDSRITDLKSAHEKQLTEKDQRLNDKTDRINDLKTDREKDRELTKDMLNSANQLIQSLQSQVAQLEAPKRPVSSNFETVEVDADPKQEKPEQGTGEQEIASTKDHNPKKGLLGRLFS